MSNYKPMLPAAGFQAFGDTATVQNHPLGMRAAGVDPTLGYAEFQYVQGSTHAAGLPVVIIANTAKALASATNFGSAAPVGVAPSAMSNTNVYGWVQIFGLCDYAVINGAPAVGNQLIAGSALASGFGTAAAASAVIANQVFNAFVAASTNASTASGTVQLNYPFVRGV